MRYYLATLMLFSLVTLMQLIAAPAPDPSAILDIGPPPKGWSMEKHLQSEIGDHLISPYGRLFDVWLDPEIRRLPSVAAAKDARGWLCRNLRVTKEDGASRLRLTFRAGNRPEQVAILNLLLRAYTNAAKEKQQFHEYCLRGEEDAILELEARIESGQHRESIDRYKKAIDDARSIHIPARRAEIQRLRRTKVIKWAK